MPGRAFPPARRMCQPLNRRSCALGRGVGPESYGLFQRCIILKVFQCQLRKISVQTNFFGKCANDDIVTPTTRLRYSDKAFYIDNADIGFPYRLFPEQTDICNSGRTGAEVRSYPHIAFPVFEMARHSFTEPPDVQRSAKTI